MRPVRYWLAFVVVVPTIATSTPAKADEPPTPPRQSAPWTPPETSIPRFLVEAAETLFDQGLADPRGCEYRWIRVRVGDIQGRHSETVTTGWVLPGPNDGPRFAVAWSGLVYPLVEVGDPADLGAQTRALAERPDNTPGRPINPPRSDEAESIGFEPFHPIQICLLLRLGRADLAEALWTSAGRARDDVSYLSLATDLAWFRFNRAVRAHAEGDDALALADARALDAFWRSVDAKAHAMGLRARPEIPPDYQYKMASRYIIFLDQAPALLADQERRARERATPSPPSSAEDKATALIRDLDQIQGATTTSRRFAWLPTPQALIALGDDAVEPLIQALRHDDRLTRLYHYNRWMARERVVVGVDVIIFAALEEILKFPDLGLPRPSAVFGHETVDRDALADKIQEFWDKHQSSRRSKADEAP